jgi:LAO/AO transport system kinase
MIAVNKADGDGAERARAAAAEYRAALHILTPASATWSPPVITVSGLANLGLDTLWAAVIEHRAKLAATGALEAKRRAQDGKWMWALVEERMHARLTEDAATRTRVGALERQVTEGALSPTAAADEIAAILGL